MEAVYNLYSYKKLMYEYVWELHRQAHIASNIGRAFIVLRSTLPFHISWVSSKRRDIVIHIHAS
jgi:hypothetical protein